MNGRDPDSLGKISPVKAYTLIEAARSGLNVSALGLGVANQITQKSSLYTVVTVESFSAALGLIVLGHEFFRMCNNPRRYNSSRRSIYLLFRLSAILAGVVGLIFIADDLSSEKTNSTKQTIGTILIALGIFTSRALTTSIRVSKDINKDENEPINRMSSQSKT